MVLFARRLKGDSQCSETPLPGPHVSRQRRTALQLLLAVLLAFLVLAFPADAIGQERRLFPVKQGKLFGYIDQRGELRHPRVSSGQDIFLTGAQQHSSVASIVT